MTEPDSEATVSGQTNLNTVTGAIQLVQQVLTTLQDAGVKDVQIGAGTWTVNYMQYVQTPASSAVKAPVVAAIEYYSTNREPLQTSTSHNQTALLPSAVRPKSRFIPLCIENGMLREKSNYRDIDM